MRLFTALRLLKLKARAARLDAWTMILDAIAANAYATAERCQKRFEVAHESRRRVWMEIAQITPAADLLQQFNARKGA